MNIAIIGTGIAGMSAAWLLSKRHKVTVFEKQSRVGGHSNTVDALVGEVNTPVDTGFIVYNELNYPNLIALFDHLAVPTKASDMSFSASLDNGTFEYSGTNVNALFGQRRNIFRPRFWRMILGILRFYREAPKLLNKTIEADFTLGEYLNKNNYTKSFINDHLLPMGAAIWSTTASEMEAYPAQAFIRFFESHGLLLMKDRPKWRTVEGGSREYVKKITAPFADRIRFSEVKFIKRHDDQVTVVDNKDVAENFDQVVIGTHADEAFQLLSDLDDQEKKLLSPWRYTKNRAVLHTDITLMPKQRRVWSSWNFIEGQESSFSKRLCVTYWMNLLQALEQTTQIFLTLNPTREPIPGSIIKEFDYSHPFFDKLALVSQRNLWTLQGHRRTWYCGSYFGYGFHEDGLQSGLAVAEKLGGLKRPWKIPNESGRIHFHNKSKGSKACH